MLVIFCLLTVSGYAADWRSRVDELLDRGFEDLSNIDVTRQHYSRAEIEDVADAAPSWQSLRDFLVARPLRQKAKQKGFSDCQNLLTGKTAANNGEELLLLNRITGKDGVSRPWALYLPAGRQLLRPRAMLVALHGGVSRQNIYENPAEIVKDSPWLTLARSQGWVLLFPFGQEGATWWDDVGMHNVCQLIRSVKHHVNIDDNRVFLAGFSDGASAGFLYAMIIPDDFAAIVALNGHMGVGSLDGKLPLYAPNLAMTPVYAATTENDELYPTRRMAPTIAMARQAGANITYRQLAGTHSFDYHAGELPLIARYLQRCQRDPLPGQIFWETGDRATGSCRWLQIADIASGPPAAWHVDHNCIMADEEITWGFSGVRGSDGIVVNKIDRGGYAEAIGMRIGDVLRRAGERPITDSFSLKDARESARCGTRFDFVVGRAGKNIKLPGMLPQPAFYNLFIREVPSAAVKAMQSGNVITVEGSRVAKLRLFLHPEQFDLTSPIKVLFNGRTIFNGNVKPDSAVILAEYAANRDRKAMPVAHLDLLTCEPGLNR